jgi:eukaryotic-like serine/threonine-protein kinase
VHLSRSAAYNRPPVGIRRAATEPGTPVARHTADLDSLVGRTLGRRRYEVVARIAQGGMAVVYRGHDRQLDRVVAIKVPNPELARDQGFSEQFRREGRAAARLSHPNVVAVYDSGEDRGLPWIVMELVTGQTLRHLLDARGRLDPETTAELLGPVADALDHAHHAGIAHLDVKPENVLLSGDSVKVADFGLVRAAAYQGATGHALAATVHYCAPEVLRGGMVDGRADIYALGVVAWECLVGRPPFEGGQEQVIRQHLGGRVPPPSRRVEGIPPAVDGAVWRATDPDPDRRYLRATDFAAAIGAPRRRRIDEALRATTVLPPAAPGAEEASPADRTAAASPAAQDTAVGSAVQGGPALQRTATRLPPAAPPVPRPRPTTGRVPKTRARRGRVGRLRLVGLAVLGVLLLTGLAVGTGLIGGSVTMPSVVGQDLRDAKAALIARGLRVTVADAQPSATIREGRVVSQSVARGDSVRRRTRVVLHPSAGIRLTSLTGRPADETVRRLTRLGLKPQQVHGTSLDVPAGQVITTDPAPGAVLGDGAPVKVVVSVGKPKVDVPNVAGLDYPEARARLAAVPLGATPRLVFDDVIPEGRVVRTEPPAGARAVHGSTVTVQVSKGPDLVTVPNVVGLPKRKAEARLRAAGLRWQYELFGIGKEVRDQSPRPGERVKRGTAVRLLLNVF